MATAKPYVRFAPSPTGLLHVGNARTAVINYLFAQHHRGNFALRIDDTDAERSKPEFEAAIQTDLKWLGIEYDRVLRQSERADAYRHAANKLRKSGRLYPCYESPEVLERNRKRAQAKGLPPVYDRAALKLTDAEKRGLEGLGRKPHWRFKLSHEKVAWEDAIRGPVEIDTSTVSDPVLVREDGSYLYTLPSVVDDAELGITHIVRGEDHVTNTAAQIEIFDALGSARPNFAHHPLLVGATGEPLSKRLGSLSLQRLREEGVEPLALVSYLAKIGTSDPVAPRWSMEVLAEEFGFEKIGRAPARFDEDELLAVNGKLLHMTAYENVRSRLAELDADLGALFWDAVRPNIRRLSDVVEFKALIEGPIEPIRENPELLDKAASLLPDKELDSDSWMMWTKLLAEETGLKGKKLYHPLRLAITGQENGPELAKLLPLIGAQRVKARLKGEKT